MALITEKGKYIKVMENGDFFIYKSKEERDKERFSTSYETIINLYEEKIKELKEEYSFDVTNYSLASQIQNWSLEMATYKDDYTYKKGASMHYPLMKKYITDIESSISNVEQGSICTDKGIEDSYKIAKENHYWGNTSDDL